jgi:hypothetical protein
LAPGGRQRSPGLYGGQVVRKLININTRMEK